jgi:hypothetical protein
MSLAQLATETLQTLSVELIGPIPLITPPGSPWTVGKAAAVRVRITNTTGLPLHNVAVEAGLYGAAAQFLACETWDGHSAYAADLEPGEVFEDWLALMKGVSAGNFAFITWVGAEVLPFGAATTVSAFAVSP